MCSNCQRTNYKPIYGRQIATVSVLSYDKDGISNQGNYDYRCACCDASVQCTETRRGNPRLPVSGGQRPEPTQSGRRRIGVSCDMSNCVIVFSLDNVMFASVRVVVTL